MNIGKINKLASKGNVEKLAKMAEGKDIEEAKAAIEAIATIKKDESFNFLISNLRHPNKELRLAIIAAIGDLGMARAKVHLRHVIDNDTDVDVVNVAKTADAKLT